ncbi:hypothetical protein [Elizabethkingia anophelis]|uniref:hypothetical protein n=1 Tax=Elizabethkingia anophelis TaxID=1117645 RepID=UPI0032091EC5
MYENFNQNNESQENVFHSKIGKISKIIEFNLPNITTSYALVETRIRKVISNSGVSYFFQIEKQGEYSNNLASIEYSELKEVIDAIDFLKSNIDKDKLSTVDYIENKFSTTDGFQIGNYIKDDNVSWFINLDNGSDSSLFFSDISYVYNALINAKNRIEELKG